MKGRTESSTTGAGVPARDHGSLKWWGCGELARRVRGRVTLNLGMLSSGFSRTADVLHRCSHVSAELGRAWELGG